MGVLLFMTLNVIAQSADGVSASETSGSAPAIVPQPARMTVGSGTFTLRPSQRIVARGGREVLATAAYFAGQLRVHTGLKLEVVDDLIKTETGEILFTTETPTGEAVRLEVPAADPEALAREGYGLTVTEQGIVVWAETPHGLFNGAQTLRQLVTVQDNAGSKVVTVPHARIADWPRYLWRGMLLDCCRHFMPVYFVKRYIDLLATHKMNVLHWHLTEDQGWRLQIGRYPELIRVGARRGPPRKSYGGFYSKTEVREILRYAASRHVTVVPEIEMPGHCVAALASYPHLSCTGGPFEVRTRWGVHEEVFCAGNDEVFTFLEGVLEEVIDLFPSQYIHIGGDECPKTRWKACPKCQARIQAEGLADEHELQSWFIRRIETYLNSRGRRLIGWDEIIEGGLAPRATVQAWRSMEAAVQAARAGHDVIASPTSHCYLDYSHEAISLERIYAFEPTPAALDPAQARHILGAEGNMWTERAPMDRVDRQVWPRLCALAEVTWSPRAARDWPDFSRRMRRHYARLDRLGVDYYVEAPRCTSNQRVFETHLAVTLQNPFGSGRVHYTLDGSVPGPLSPAYDTPIQLTDTTTVNAVVVLPGGRVSKVATVPFTRQSPRPPARAGALQPGLRYAYYEGQWSALPDFNTLEALSTGVTGTPELSMRQRDDHFAVRFTGYIQVPRAGIYTFALTSDDGSRLWLGEQIVVDHDGLHSASQRLGQINLQAGHHQVTIAVFEAGGSQALSVEWEGPGVPRQPFAAEHLFHASE